jgi:predicted dehydrogenase
MNPPGAVLDSGQGLNLAVFGTGRWGKTLIRAVAAHTGLALAAVISSKSAAVGSDAANVPVFPTWQDACDAHTIDGFVLALPPDRQPGVAVEIFVAGIPVFLEKPLALNRADAQRMLVAARKFGFTGVVDHIHLFTAEFQELCRRLPPDGAGLVIETASGNRGPFRERWTSCWDWAPHDIAMCLAVMKTAPQTATARVTRSVEEDGHILENYEIHLDFGPRGQAAITTGNAFDGHRREFHVRAGATSLIYRESPKRTRSLVQERAGRVETITVESAPPLDTALSAFADRIRRNSDNLDDIETGARVVNICAAAHESVLSGRPVAVCAP